MHDPLTIADADRLTNEALLAALERLAAGERGATAELVAHLAALDGRPGAFAGLGYGSLFAYCTRRLRLSEDAACNRIEAARACRRFPIALEGLRSGDLTVTALRMLGRHLTAANHREVLGKAYGRSLRELEVLVATLAPKPDAVTLVRRLPDASTLTASAREGLAMASPEADVRQLRSDACARQAPSVAAPGVATAPGERPSPGGPPPLIRPTAPERYRVQFTIGADTERALRRLQDLLRREIPNGDPAAIVDRALRLLLADVERKKLGAAIRPVAPPIRRATDRRAAGATRVTISASGAGAAGQLGSRTVPRAVKRVVSARDERQCAYRSPDGVRCTERAYLEFHHLQPYALRGPATVDNIALRCRRHNQYEAEQAFGPWNAERSDQ
jgi:hypothetical protein